MSVKDKLLSNDPSKSKLLEPVKVAQTPVSPDNSLPKKQGSLEIKPVRIPADMIKYPKTMQVKQIDPLKKEEEEQEVMAEKAVPEEVPIKANAPKIEAIRDKIAPSAKGPKTRTKGLKIGTTQRPSSNQLPKLQVAVRCSAITRNGTRCRRMTKSPTGLCPAHRK